MYKMTIILLSFIFYFQIINGKAQSKYALVIGINEYYEKPGVMSSHNLKGCVNDALSIQSLLRNRFSFKKENIKTLLNAQATQANMTIALANILLKGKAGDAVVFYFCGHGIYMSNPANAVDPVKQGYNQALCMSDLYAPNLDCLVKDNTLKKLFNQFVDKKMILTALFDCCFSGGLAMAPYDQACMFNKEPDTEKALEFEAVDEASRAFNMGETPMIADYSHIQRPSETPNSKFASISACTDNQVAMEIYDESGVPHGALTKAILSIYERSKSDLPLSKVMTEITNQIKDKQLYLQDPTYQFDKQRSSTNLIGLPLATLKRPFVATCTRYANRSITFNAGWIDGIAIGNTFSDKHRKLSFRITKVYRDSAISVSKTNVLVKKGDLFELADRYRSSESFLKVFIPELNLNTTAFLSAFNKKVRPLTNSVRYIDYYNTEKLYESFNFVFTNQPDAAKEFLTIPKDSRFSVVSHLPTDMAIAIRKKLAEDQNMKLVSSAQQADVVLYLSYTVPTKYNSNASFVLTYRPAFAKTVIPVNGPTFCVYRVNLNKLATNQKSRTELAAQVLDMTRTLIRAKTTWWLNGYAKK